MRHSLFYLPFHITGITLYFATKQPAAIKSANPTAPTPAPQPITLPDPNASAPKVTGFNQKRGIDKRKLFGSAGIYSDSNNPTLGSGI